ncbi:MAG: glycoside hydrolase family 3 C-terminal domain-containing protein [Gemmatimonadaceae bacterium]|nr:glycoside hydrolase family 3 C-terminal domain-containing protein [Gemmatimonadaceae bacterium]
MEAFVADLLSRMTREEKLGQLQQVQGTNGHVADHLADAVRRGAVGSIINEVDPATIRSLQWIARHESRLGIPLLIGRDVIHGFHTVFPIPLGQAATWNPQAVEQAARLAAEEATAVGINWTFAPMLDVGRDARWGRVAEGYGEDPYLIGEMGAAAVRGFQTDDPTRPDALAACAKHFMGYGASEAGKDYNSTNIPPHELRNVHLPPFRAAVDAGVLTVMTSFSDVDGIPATANATLLRDILRDDLGFDGLVVSDWDAVPQLTTHGLTADDREAALAAAQAGVDMEMASRTYAHHLPALLAEGLVDDATIDAMVRHILRVKVRLGLFDRPLVDPAAVPPSGAPATLAAARDVARDSLVLLRNAHALLPLDLTSLRSVALVGALADDPWEQLGTWIFDGRTDHAVTVREALAARLGDAVTLRYERGHTHPRARDREGHAAAVAAAAAADVAVLVLGEDAILSGEAHCRADVSLPGDQRALIADVVATGTPVVVVIMAGRALALEGALDGVAAVLYAWHPGVMGGAAIVDVLCGDASPSGRLPVSLPRVTGQVPLYYAHKRTGKPATPETIVHESTITGRVPQLSVGNTSFHLDVHPTPLFPFGYGLSYTRFAYEQLRVSHHTLRRGESLTVAVDLLNTGDRAGTEVVQLYLNDPVASLTRPVRELRRFARVALAPGARQTVTFTLTESDLAFSNRHHRRTAEAGVFHLWVGGDATAELHASFTLVD